MGDFQENKLIFSKNNPPGRAQIHVFSQQNLHRHITDPKSMMLQAFPRSSRAPLRPAPPTAVAAFHGLSSSLPRRQRLLGLGAAVTGLVAAVGRKEAKKERFPEAVEVEATLAPGVKVKVLEASLDWSLGLP